MMIAKPPAFNVAVSTPLITTTKLTDPTEACGLWVCCNFKDGARGWRPSYRNILLTVQKDLNIPCSTKFSSEDLEAEIFLYLLHYKSSEEYGTSTGLLEFPKPSNIQGTLEFGLSQRMVWAFSTLNSNFWSVILKLSKGLGRFF